jgi:hypothetical protein
MKRQTETHAAPAKPVWNALSPVGSEPWAAAADCATAMFQGFEAMRKVQEHTAHEAARHHASAADRLKNGCGAAEIAAIQGDLLRFDFETAAQYWQQLVTTGVETQMRMLGAWGGAINSDTMLESLSALSGKPH